MLPTISQLISEITADVPIAARAVCATVLSARMPAFRSQSFQQRFMDYPLSACGFDAPVFTAAVTSEDGSTVQLAYACGTDGWYLQVEGDTSVYTVDISTVQALLLTENDLKTQE